MFDFKDLLSDSINRVLMCQNMGLSYVFLGFSKKNFFIFKILKREGYIENMFLLFFHFNIIVIKLKYYKNEPVIKCFKKISKYSLKIYKGYRFIPKVMNNLGVIILSTNKGFITDKFAKKNGIGGELICYVF